MNKKEVASYMIIDSANFIKKTVKKGSYFSMKWLGVITFLASGILVGDTLIHKEIYDKHNISSIDVIQNNNRFVIEKPINLLATFQEEDDNINLPQLRHSYVPIVAEFSEKNTYNSLTSEDLSLINHNLAGQYTQICTTGIVSRLICVKYDKYDEIARLQN